MSNILKAGIVFAMYKPSSTNHQGVNMKVSETIQTRREHKIAQMMQITGCSRDYAIAYLMAEEWFVSAAVDSYNASHG
jgi:hypothetical protein